MAAWAQIPPTAESSRAADQFRELVVPETAPVEAPATPGLPLQEAPAGAEEIVFRLEKISLEGMSVYDTPQMDSLYADKIGQDVTLAWLFDLANAITIKYRNDGYILSRAIVPQQEIRAGHVTLRVVEGYVDKIVINNAADLKTEERIP